jgi:NAD(P)-dependent dehydrogenase (short-subunit alcohol dehydrogenase family)
MPDFEGLRALATGGASGIGLTTARLLNAEGATVAVLDREPFAGAENDRLHFVQAAVTDDDAVRRAVEAALAQLGGLDVLVEPDANPGAGPRRSARPRGPGLAPAPRPWPRRRPG